MKRAFILICILLTTATATAQFGGQRQNRFGRQQPNTPPNESQKALMEKKNEERKIEIIMKFVSSLEADDFQKEIAKQTLEDYFSKIQSFMKLPFDNSVQQKDAFEAFRKEHFKELKTLFSEKDNEKLDEFLEGKFKEKDSKKKKRKKKKRNKDN